MLKAYEVHISASIESVLGPQWHWFTCAMAMAAFPLRWRRCLLGTETHRQKNLNDLPLGSLQKQLVTPDIFASVGPSAILAAAFGFLFIGIALPLYTNTGKTTNKPSPKEQRPFTSHQKTGQWVSLYKERGGSRDGAACRSVPSFSLLLRPLSSCFYALIWGVGVVNCFF